MNRRFLVRLLLIALSYASVAAALSSMPNAAVGFWYLFYSPVMMSALSFGLWGALAGSAAAAFALVILLSRAHVALYQTAAQVTQNLMDAGISVSDITSAIQSIPAATAGAGHDAILLLSLGDSPGMQWLTVSLGVGLITLSSCLIGWHVDEARRRSARAYDEARTDSMTGLPNYRRLRERLEAILGHSHVPPERFCLLVVDIDNLKTINDSYGHLIGDAAIRYVADALRDNVRPTDTVARYGGDEFAVLLEGIGLEDGIRVGERILGSLAAEQFLPGAGIHSAVRISIGVAAYPADGSRAETLLAAADDAMYHAKQAGGSKLRLAAASAALRSAALRSAAPANNDAEPQPVP